MTSPYDLANRVLVEGTVGEGQLEMERRNAAGLAAAAMMARQQERTMVDTTMSEGEGRYGGMTPGLADSQQTTNTTSTQERELLQTVSGNHEESFGGVGGSTTEELFDWERWDAVFGQYNGYTDLMEDIVWNPPDE